MYLQRKGPTRQQGTRPGRRRTTGRVAVATYCARRHLHMSARRCRRPLPLSASDPWWPGRRIFFRSAGLAITASRAPGPESQYPRGQRRVAAVPARVKATLPLLLRGFSVSPHPTGARGVPPDKEGTTRGVALRLGPSPSQTASRHHLTRRHTHTPGGGGVGGTRAATEHRRGRDRDSISRCGSAALLDRRRVVLTSVISVTGESTARTWRGRRAKRAARRHLAVGRGPVAAHARTRVSRAAAAGSEQP
jgi:hypothetical protein